MTESQEFEKLKNDVISGYLNYIEKIKEFSFEDTRDTAKRLELIDAYDQSIIKSLSYRNFIGKIIPLKNNSK